MLTSSRNQALYRFQRDSQGWEEAFQKECFMKFWGKKLAAQDLAGEQLGAQPLLGPGRVRSEAFVFPGCQKQVWIGSCKHLAHTGRPPPPRGPEHQSITAERSVTQQQASLYTCYVSDTDIPQPLELEQGHPWGSVFNAGVDTV